MIDSLSNQSHPAEFAGNIDSGNIGFERRLHLGNVDASLFASKDKGDGFDRTGRLAGSMSDTMVRLHQDGLSSNDSQRVLRTGLHAGAGPDAFIGIDHRVQRQGLGNPGLDRFVQPRPRQNFSSPASTAVEHEDDEKGNQVEQRDEERA